jgi:hypothetical protein
VINGRLVTTSSSAVKSTDLATLKPYWYLDDTAPVA